jgi:hypothetical protein
MNPDSDDPFKEHADLIQAFEGRPLMGSMKVPERVLIELEKVREETVRGSTFSVIQGGAQDTLKREQPKGGTHKLERRAFPLLRLAAVLALLATGTWLLLPPATPTARVVVTSPGDVISETRPRIAWNSKDKPGQKYDVWILPAEGDHLTAPALFVAKEVTSPVRLDEMKPGPEMLGAELEPGKDYRVLVCLAAVGRHAGVPVPFRVEP